MRISYAVDPTKWMEGIVSAFSGTTLIVTVDLVASSGTFTNWNINIAGIRGETGATGLAGDQIRNYGESLIRNGALEYGTTQHWTGATISGSTFEGMKVLEGTTMENTASFYVRRDRLYSLSAYVECADVFSLALVGQNATGGVLTKSGMSGVYFLSNHAASPTFSLVSGIVGGLGVTAYNFPGNVVLAKFWASSPGSLKMSKLVVKEVSLGEPVPYNFGYLPSGQMVYDPTTGDIGRFNGTAVVWAS